MSVPNSMNPTEGGSIPARYLPFGKNAMTVRSSGFGPLEMVQAPTIGEAASISLGREKVPSPGMVNAASVPVAAAVTPGGNEHESEGVSAFLQPVLTAKMNRRIILFYVHEPTIGKEGNSKYGLGADTVIRADDGSGKSVRTRRRENECRQQKTASEITFEDPMVRGATQRGTGQGQNVDLWPNEDVH